MLPSLVIKIEQHRTLHRDAKISAPLRPPFATEPNHSRNNSQVPPRSEPPIYKWSRPLLPGSAQNIENDVTYRKQTTEKFLPGATTHIRIFRLLPFSFPRKPRNRTPLSTPPEPRIGVFRPSVLPWIHHHQPAISAISTQAWGRGE